MQVQFPAQLVTAPHCAGVARLLRGSRMAIIDGLIGLLDFQRADALVLQPNAAPMLMVQGSNA